MNKKILRALLISSIIILSSIPISQNSRAGFFTEDEEPDKYTMEVYDNQGRFLNTSYEAVENNLEIEIYDPGMIGRGDHLGTWVGKNPITFKTTRSTVIVDFFWMGSKYMTKDKNLPPGGGNISFNLDITPAKPISNYEIQDMTLSSDLHSVSGPSYDLQFGSGSSNNLIEYSQDDLKKNIEAKLTLNNETYPFQMIAEKPGEATTWSSDTWGLWEKSYHASYVDVNKISGPSSIGGNTYVLTWSYSYSDSDHDLLADIGKNAMAGATIGAVAGFGSAGPVGALGGSLAGGLGGAVGSGIAYAVEPELQRTDSPTGVGVLACVLTPEFMYIQTQSIQENCTGSTETHLENTPGPGKYLTTKGNLYEIDTDYQSYIKSAFTEGSGHTIKHYWDFESDPAYVSDVKPIEDGRASLTDADNNHYIEIKPTSKGWSYFIDSADGVNASADLHYNEYNQTEIGIDVKMDFMLDTDLDYTDYNEKTIDVCSPNDRISHLPDYVEPGEWEDIDFHGELNPTTQGDIRINFPTGYNSGFQYYIDNLKVLLYYKNETKTLFSQEDTAPIVRHLFGNIPTIAPSKVGRSTNIDKRYALLGVDIGDDKNSTLALDWKSRTPRTHVSRLILKSDTWEETSFLLQTDDPDGFLNTNFTLTRSDDFIYKVSWGQYNLFSGPSSWSYDTEFDPLVVNDSTYYIPEGDPTSGFNFPKLSYDLSSWWNRLNAIGKFLIFALPFLAIGLVLLIFAPWLLYAIIKVFVMAIKGVIGGLSSLVRKFKKGGDEW